MDKVKQTINFFENLSKNWLQGNLIERKKYKPPCDIITNNAGETNDSFFTKKAIIITFFSTQE